MATKKNTGNLDKQLSKQRSYFVAKDNLLITKSRYSLSLQQQRILLYLISLIKPTDEPQTNYEITIRDIINVCGYNHDGGIYYKALKDDIKKLRDMSSWIDLGDKEVLFSWLDKAEINKQTGKITISFHYTVADYLFELRNKYTSYSLFNVLTLSHKYSIRLYEYLCANKYRNEFTISIDELRTRIDVNDYKDDFYNFRKRVLIPSINDINNKTDIFVEYRLHKTGKSYSHITFEYLDISDRERIHTINIQNNMLNPTNRRLIKQYQKTIYDSLNKKDNDNE